jgi:DNA-binding MarR family transcriptional regulator
MDRQEALNLLDASLYRLRRQQSSRRAARALADRSGVDLSPLALTILSDIDRHGPVRVQMLAERIGTEVPRVSREVRELEVSGHLRVGSDAADRRARVAALTNHGTEQLVAYVGASRSMLGDLLTDWDDRDVEAIAVLFDRFVSAPPLTERPPKGGEY